MITDWAPEHVVTEVRAAEAAARAARAVPGVVRLQPGVLGLLGQFAAEAWEQATGEELPDIGGVHAELVDGGAVRLDLRIVVDGGYRAVDVGVAVQDAVTAAVGGAVDLRAHPVLVHVVEIDLDADQVIR
jgi:uncharacterized alkaline shock family protein YloU